MIITTELIRGILLPFVGTSAGAACVFFMRNQLKREVQRALTGFAAGVIIPAMPYLLSFAAGAMLYVVVEELIPEMSAGEHTNTGVLMFAAGFALMMALDVALS